MTKLSNINNRIFEITKNDLQYKTFDQLYASLLEELGEVATELKIENKVFGNAHKNVDEGSKGESVDLYICCIAVFYASLPKNTYVNYALELLEDLIMEDELKEDVFWYLRSIVKSISSPYNYSDIIPAAQDAINIFFKTGTEDEFHEIADRKLTKWEKSQNDCIKNVATQQKINPQSL